MLIKALCDYYDVLSEDGKVLPEGYSKVKIHYLICLTPEGKIDEIIPWQKEELISSKSGKIKVKLVPKMEVMPRRTEKPGIDANMIEHRPLYIFGLNYDAGVFRPEDKTHKAKKSHEAFVQANRNFLKGMDSPVVHAYRAFLENWIPEDEKENPFLLKLGKNYGNSGFAFCLTGEPDQLLHEDAMVKEKWEAMRDSGGEEGTLKAQCSVCGEVAPIARVHNKIKGVSGGLSTGSVLIGFNNFSEESYGNEQSYNSNISEKMMKRYSETLNYLLGERSHKELLDDVTVVFWAMNKGGKEESLMSALFFGESEFMSAEQTEGMLKSLLKDAAEGSLVQKRIAALDGIDPEVDFYMLGLKPNSSRLAVKFFYRKKYGEILWNIVKHQKDMQVSEDSRPLPFWRIRRSLLSPKSQNDKVNPMLLAKVFESVMYGTAYPVSLLEHVVRRVKTDSDMKIDDVRAGVIKACINRNLRIAGKEEEIKMALDKENCSPAYLCGRLFAVLEKLQQEASGNSLNRTIKDAYFASAASRPVLVFPKLLRLAQNHLNKAKSPIYYNILIGEIMDKMQGEFPGTLLLADQGKFIIGYYQQYQSFFVKNPEKEVEVEKE